VNATSSDAKHDLAPTGRLRAAINLGNGVIAQWDAATGELKGVSVELARELARRLQIRLDLRTYDAAGKVFEALKRGEWDIAFLAVDPVRAAAIEFTAPYVLIEGNYVVLEHSDLKTTADVDKAGLRIAVASGSAYDFISRAQSSMRRSSARRPVRPRGRRSWRTNLRWLLVSSSRY
jgi:polar amino acid transport system substrate-binding protein